MKQYLVHGAPHRIDGSNSNGPGFVTPKDPVVKPPKATPRLAIDDPLAPRLKKADSNDEAEARYEKQRKLIKAYKQENPKASVNQMFSELGQQYPEVFSDPDDEDDQDEPVRDVKGRLAAKREVIAHFRAAHPEMSVDEVFAHISRLNPEFSVD
jgi:hypothetical protein